MEEINNICKGCMNHIASGGKCPKCGFDESLYRPQPHHLKPGTILAGKYMVGKKLGEGGFGITYIGIDLNLNLRAAIKEYFPSGCVSRNTDVSDTLTVFDGETREFFESGRNKFIEEARTIAQFNDADGIVSVKDFFLENGTAYIVMEYLDGESMKDFLNRVGGRMNVDDALNMIKPVISSLIQLHKAGLIHRDISPDNIMLTKNGRVKLIDFGAARDINPEGNRSLSIQLKPGYAPEEQYRTHGNQGPWTDVYALCATIYRMITGRVPEESNERLVNDTLVPPSALGVQIRPDLENALMRGMSVRADDRVRDMSTLYDTFYNNAAFTAPPVKRQTQGNNTASYAPAQPKNSVSGAKIAIIALCVTALIAATAIITVFMLSRTETDETEDVSAAQVEPTPTIEPTPTPLPPRQDLYNANLEYKRMSSIHSSYLASDDEYLALKDVILAFDDNCPNYMNYGDTTALGYLKPGSTAYEQQTDYKRKHSSIYERFNYVDVINARTDGSSYYVWVTEDMTVTENGETKNSVEHWVYRLEKSGDRYVIADYTRDPLYS